jgi:hypothetical protein
VESELEELAEHEVNRSVNAKELIAKTLLLLALIETWLFITVPLGHLHCWQKQLAVKLLQRAPTVAGKIRVRLIKPWLVSSNLHLFPNYLRVDHKVSNLFIQ